MVPECDRELIQSIATLCERIAGLSGRLDRYITYSDHWREEVDKKLSKLMVEHTVIRVTTLGVVKIVAWTIGAGAAIGAIVRWAVQSHI